MIETAFALLIVGMIFGLEVKVPLAAFMIVAGYFYISWRNHRRLQQLAELMMEDE